MHLTLANENIPVIVLAAVAGVLAVVLIVVWTRLRRYAQARRKAEDIIEEARREGERLQKESKLEARDEVLKAKDQFQRESEAARTELKETERRLSKREDSLAEQGEMLVRKEKTVEAIEARLSDREKELTEQEAKLTATLAEEMEHLTRISGMGREEACQTFLRMVGEEMEQEEAEIVQNAIERANETASEKSREIIVQSIQRMASDVTAQSTVSSVDIPNDDMKGRVIGREGRNIRAFEKATGIDVIVDDTPGVVIVSGHDPVRREIAKRAMSKLILDGRIHPSRIEEVVAETKKEVDEQINEVGRQVILDLKLRGVNNKLVPLMGRLQFRTSYGQNVLTHSLEVARLSAAIAEQLGLDARLAQRCGLLHDIGKAIDHEVEGGHPKIGADLLRRHGERAEVVEAAAGHHDLKQAMSIYSWIVSAADAVSASRPGARRESLERYIERLEKLESIAMAFKGDGVESAYAIQAGREVRVIINAEKADDAMSIKLARDIARQIEGDLTYPGEIRITVIREKRAVEYARHAS
ncbi:MAG: ribonuclease Y [Anaerolineaceae bacterium]|nr:ribonuclease Y [Anaerolineaceae bacterium]